MHIHVLLQNRINVQLIWNISTTKSASRPSQWSPYLMYLVIWSSIFPKEKFRMAKVAQLWYRMTSLGLQLPRPEGTAHQSSEHVLVNVSRKERRLTDVSVSKTSKKLCQMTLLLYGYYLEGAVWSDKKCFRLLVCTISDWCVILSVDLILYIMLEYVVLHVPKIPQPFLNITLFNDNQN